MDVREIPRIIFNEFTENKREKTVYSGTMMIGDVIGVEGSILGLRVDTNVFVYWWLSEQDAGEWNRAKLRIKAGFLESGVWASGTGRMFNEGVTLETEGVRMGKSSLVVAEIIKRASNLVISLPLEPTDTWERDI